MADIPCGGRQERRLPLDGCFNCRDMGGYVREDSRSIAWGRIFRSDALHRLSPRDKQYFESLGLRTVIDFRSPGEAEKQKDILPAGASHEILNPHANLAQAASAVRDNDEEKIKKLLALTETPEGREFFKKNANAMADQMRLLVTGQSALTAYGLFFRRLLEAPLPLLFHCQGGKDRTGWAAVLFLLALGFSRECARSDYLLTREMNRERNQRRMDEYRQYTDHPLVLEYLYSLMDVREVYIDAAFAEMDRVAKNPQEYLQTYLQVSPQDLSALQAKYIV
ncbi:protein-tyrosine phosphatase [Treponema primitia ZAS-2]|uniref:Protein-tyrosine phosphatase n=1 Tax=Treponema primitia (strain ATCC BAA-887 / DSM 12427 / ZAS-2) TaxID=545694 RepID=F5YLG8_TREPZ|nr:tyrosine-protein phosphatase [Treponema primitia]AEF85864.1 protein-tyrosine phosphatase [Treponema primitia ZAS-2]